MTRVSSQELRGTFVKLAGNFFLRPAQHLHDVGLDINLHISWVELKPGMQPGTPEIRTSGVPYKATLNIM